MLDIYRAEENAYFPVRAIKRTHGVSGKIADAKKFFPGAIVNKSIVYQGRSFPIPEWFQIHSSRMEAIAFFWGQGTDVRLVAMGVTEKVYQTIEIPPHLLREDDAL
jgi:hypothetical protein